LPHARAKSLGETVHTSKLVALLAGLAVGALAWAQDAGIDAARQFFTQYVALEQAYDPGVADLYADQALIRTRRKPPMGDPQTVTVPASQYKALLRGHMLVAAARGDRSTYSDVTYSPEGPFVRIDATRVSGPRKSQSPISLLVGQSPSGRWLIYEELSESPP
jgi:hypothetical protein